MSRKPVYRSLPALAAVYPEFHGFAPAENKTAAILRLLRQLAEQVRQRQAVPFYAMLDVARFFGVAYKTVAQTYAKLEAEGLLRRKRGAYTLVCPRRPQPSQPVRGVIGVPIWLPGFMAFRDSCVFFLRLDEELRRRQFVADLIFYRQGEETDPAFVDRVQVHHPDAVVWLCPALADRPTLGRLLDAGLPLVVIADRPGRFRANRYRIRWEQGLRQGLEAWRREGIRTLEIPHPADGATSSATHCLPVLLKEMAWPHSGPQPKAANTPLSDYLGRLGRHGAAGVVFDDSSWYERLCTVESRAMLALFQRARVMVMCEVTLPLEESAPARADFVGFDWPAIARRIADDLTENVGGAAPEVVFEASYRPRCDLWDVAQRLRFH